MQYSRLGDLFELILYWDVYSIGDNFEQITQDWYQNQVYFILIDILKVLSFLHEGLGMAHWDIKPHNIMLDFNLEIKLSDFGLSKLL